MSTQRDRVMAAYPGVIVIDYERLGDHPEFSGAPRFLIYDKRLPDDPGALPANQAANRAGVKAAAQGGNATGDTLCGMWFVRTNANLGTFYP